MLFAWFSPQAHREKYKSLTKEYDVDLVTHLVEQIQAMAGDIYNDRTSAQASKKKEKK